MVGYYAETIGETGGEEKNMETLQLSFVAETESRSQ